MSHVAAIIPAYNETATIEEVVRIVLGSPLIDEVLVVSDGSDDDTAAIAKAAGAHVITHSVRQGKGAALHSGVQKTTAPILVFFDADLRGLCQEHIERLIYPVLYGVVSMNVGMRDRGFINSVVAHLPLISGERALQRSIFEGVPTEFLHGFMVECALNYFCKTRRLSVGKFLMKGLTIRRKYEKVGWLRALPQYGKMAGDMLRAWVGLRLARLVRRF